MPQKPFSLMAPPANLPVIDLSVLMTSTQIEYSTHPAYAPFFRQKSMRGRIQALMCFAKYWLLIKVKRLIRYEMIPLDTRKPRNAIGWLRLLATATRHAVHKARRPPVAGQNAKPNSIEGQFRTLGCVVVSMPPHLLEDIRRLSEPAFSALETRRSQKKSAVRDFEESRYYSSRSDALALFELIDRILQESGLLDTASAYLGRRARLVDVNPQINDSSDDFWRRVFPDLSDPLPHCAYFHRDASGGDLKAIFYLTDVSPRNGPFEFVIGSHLLQTGTFETHTCESNDSNGLSGTDPLSRQLFAKLPSRLRMKGAFGNDVVDGSSLDAAITASRWSITGQAGSIVMFDTKGVHRGGMVLDGERKAITCVIG